MDKSTGVSRLVDMKAQTVVQYCYADTVKRKKINQTMEDVFHISSINLLQTIRNILALFKFCNYLLFSGHVVSLI